MGFKIKVAKTAGFCFGVQRALEKVLDLIRKSDDPVRTLGPLIHNDQVLESLKLRGVDVWDANEKLCGQTVVIRAHGVTPSSTEVLKQNDVNILNATCPKVAKVQGIVKKYASIGYQIIIVGDRGHAEVEGLVGYTAGRADVISGIDDATKLPEYHQICVVAQTTQSRHRFDTTVEYLKSRYDDCVVFDTICSATSERQEETVKLAEKSDLMIVVGGKKSANTKRLADISSEFCRTVLVHSSEDITPQIINNANQIGITAGASTPSWVIREVVDKVREVGWVKSGGIYKLFHYSIGFLLKCGVISSLGLGFLTGALSIFLNIPINPSLMVIAFWMGLIWSTCNAMSAQKKLYTESRLTRHPIMDYPNAWLSGLGVLSVIAILLLSVQGLPVFIWGIFASLICLFCFVHIGEWKFKISAVSKFINNYPAVKDIFTCITEAFIVVWLPAIAYSKSDMNTIFFFVYVMLLLLIREIMVDSRELQIDLISGKQTVLMILGKNRIQMLLQVMVIIWALTIIMPVVFGSLSAGTLILLIVPAFYALYTYLFHHRLMFLRITSDLAIESGTWIVVLLSLVYVLFLF